jgi:8-amino-7-oxononanoate synthase
LLAVRGRPELKQSLWANARRLHAGLTALGYRLASGPSPVIAVQVPSHDEAARMWNALLAEGVYVNLVVPPAAPEGASLLRCSLSAGHTFEQIDRIVTAFESVRAGAATAVAE